MSQSPAPLRPAATTILVRDGADGPEVWLMERNRAIAFMGSAWVFPGGRVDDADHAAAVEAEPAPSDLERVPRPFWVAAARELEEEAGVRLGDRGYALDRLSIWAHWITPEVEPRRFDTWFFLARLPAGVEAAVDGGEAVRGGWFRPHDAIEAAQRGELPVAPPTLRTLFELAPYRSVDALFAAHRHTPPICPKFQQVGDELYVLLPGDPDHPSAEQVDPPFRYQFAAGRWWARDKR